MSRINVIALHGEYDVAEKPSLERNFAQMAIAPAGTLTIIDLRGVTYLDSTMLNALCRRQKRLLRERPGSSICVVASRTSFAWRLFEITRLDRFIPVFEDMKSAITLASPSMSTAYGTPFGRSVHFPDTRARGA